MRSVKKYLDVKLPACSDLCGIVNALWERCVALLMPSPLSARCIVQHKRRRILAPRLQTVRMKISKARAEVRESGL